MPTRGKEKVKFGISSYYECLAEKNGKVRREENNNLNVQAV